MAKTDWKQGAVQGLTPYPPSLTHTITADRQEEESKDNLSGVNNDLRVQYKLNKDYFSHESTQETEEGHKVNK